MKYKLLLLLGFIYSFANVLNCQSVSIKNGQSITISPFYVDKSKVQIDTIHLSLEFSKEVKDSIIKFKLDAGGLPNNPILSTYNIKIPDGRGKINSTLDTILILMTTKVEDTLQKDEIGFVRIEDNYENFITIRLSAKRQFDSKTPFWIEMGANLDLVDGLKPNNLFSAVILYKRDIRALSKKWPSIASDRKNIGLYAGVFESKAVSTVNNSNNISISYTSSQSFSHPSRDSAFLFKDTGQIKTSQEIRNLGLFFSPQFRITGGSANEDGIHLFLALWAEIQWQQISNKFDYSNLRRLDSLTIPLSGITLNNSLKNNSTFEVYTHYEGIGIPVFYQEKQVNCFLNFVIGASNQLRSNLLRDQNNISYDNLNRVWNPFYAVQFRLNEEHYGFAFSGEVRGLLKQNDKPFVTLILSKKFDLSRLLEF